MQKKRNCLRRLPAALLCLVLLGGCGGQTEDLPSDSENHFTTFSPSPEPAVVETWQDALRALSYCGDVDKCAMTAQQALAYAQLLADGIAGKVAQPPDRYSPAQSDRVFWDTPYTVMGYSGAYQTDRANAILGDFAGDGEPYLCVLSSTNPDCGFDVYYSGGGAADFVYGDETYGGRLYTTFGLDETGKMTVSSGGANSAYSHSTQRLGFAGGKTEVLHSYTEEVDSEAQLVHVTLDGVESTYSLEQWQEQDGSAELGELPNAGYTPVPLREMIGYLNQYAAAKGSAQSVTVEERSEGSQIAQAMLSALDSCLNENAGGSGDARLVDLNGDGTDELVVYNGTLARLYMWLDGALQSKDVGWAAGSQIEWWLCQDSGAGEKGIEWQSGSFDGASSASTFYYLSGETTANVSKQDGKASYLINGEEADEAAYNELRERNQRVEELIAPAGSPQRIEQTRETLKGRL